MDVIKSSVFSKGYGTSFECTSVCHFISIAFGSLLLLFILLILVVPVSTTKYVKTLHNNPSSSKRKQIKQPKESPLHIPSHLLDPYVPLPAQEASSSDEETHQPSIATDDYDFISSLADSKKAHLKTPGRAKPTLKMPSPTHRRSSADEFGYEDTLIRTKSMEAAKRVQEHVKRVNIASKNDRRKDLRAVDVSYENLCDEAILEHEYLEFVRGMLDGIALTKIKSNGKLSKRIFTLSHDLTQLQWSKVHGLLRKPRGLFISDLVGVTTGQGPHGMYLSLLKKDNSALDVEAENDTVLHKLVNGFSMLLREQNPPVQS
ncbi:hypothetical protein THRCLA_21251 [Thraustotheca clavata]|uniref:Uncharacterized protein n=1 Tax=Thraustotheca clavata TaxID=74557 RepID=A0A1V9ZYH5_9STRA|nr:hypothetical protein THRCLA_21251 [Thraustotheca clavata]